LKIGELKSELLRSGSLKGVDEQEAAWRLKNGVDVAEGEVEGRRFLPECGVVSMVEDCWWMKSRMWWCSWMKVQGGVEDEWMFK
jgi:hypothetical protein